MWRRNHHAARTDLIEERREIRPKITELDDIAVCCKFVLGPQQQPSASRVEPFDTRQVQSNPFISRHTDSAQPTVKFRRGRNQPITSRRDDERSRFLGFDECSGDGRHDL
jgi:hypothetical protein